jgi:uncharacterized protein with NRDE domain
MCLIGIVWKAHARHDLVLAANRDEFHNRPSAAAAPWKDRPAIFGGRDLKVGGSWLAVATSGRLAAVTNVRRMVPPDPQAPSRGKLVGDFLAGSATARDYAQGLADDAGNFSGFNLVLYDGAELLFVTNAPEYEIQAIAPGVHTVSNAPLDTSWPKARRLHAALEGWTRDNWESFPPLFKALGDRVPAPDAELPKTGVGPQLERLLSSPFIVSPHYGTRCSTIVTIGKGQIDFAEKRFDAGGVATGDTQQVLKIA